MLNMIILLLKELVSIVVYIININWKDIIDIIFPISQIFVPIIIFCLGNNYTKKQDERNNKQDKRDLLLNNQMNLKLCQGTNMKLMLNVIQIYKTTETFRTVMLSQKVKKSVQPYGFDFNISFENIAKVLPNSILLEEISPLSGTITKGSNTNIGYLSQNINFENKNNTVLEEFRRDFDGTETVARSILAKFLFYGENVFKSISKLSGGEKVRLIFAKLIQNDINFLILDEPTNHIDIDTKEMLEESLLEFKGTILFVSHDRYFANKIGTKVLELNNQKIKLFDESYNEYLNR